MYFSICGAELEEALGLRFRAEAHHGLHPGAVVPAAIEDHDLARGGEVRHVALDVHLTLLAVGRGGERHQPEHARADALGDRLDGAPLAGGVPPFEEHHHAETFLLDPLLEMAELHLEPVQLLLVGLPLHLPGRVAAVLRSSWP